MRDMFDLATPPSPPSLGVDPSHKTGGGDGSSLPEIPTIEAFPPFLKQVGRHALNFGRLLKRRGIGRDRGWKEEEIATGIFTEVRSIDPIYRDCLMGGDAQLWSSPAAVSAHCIVGDEFYLFSNKGFHNLFFSNEEFIGKYQAYRVTPGIIWSW